MRSSSATLAHGFLLVVCCLLIEIVSMCSASGQGFMVKPMRVDAQAAAGETINVDIEVRNSLGRPQPISIKPMQLWQGADGTWVPLDSDVAQTHQELRSALGWMSLASDSMEVPEYGAGSVGLTIDVPRNTRGTYCFALMVRSEEPEQRGFISVVIQFLIPVIVEVQGTSARERVSFGDVTLEQDAETAQSPAALVAHLHNEGETLVRVGGELRLLSQQGAAWRPVATAPIRTRSMLPGVELALQGSVGRRLPSGAYRLEGHLTANGRRLGTVTREVEFEGDPDAKLLADLPLEVDALVPLEAVQGATRSGSVTVKNPSTEVAQVEAQVLQHQALRGVGNEELDGAELHGSDWVTVMPESFPLRGGTERALRLMVQMPQVEKPLPNYYALLKLGSSYADGSEAGGAESVLWLRNEAVESRLEAEPLSLQLADDEPNKYAVTARFVNSGTIHWNGTCRAEVQASATVTPVSGGLETETPLLLPLGTGTYSGVLDFSEVEAGNYVLRAVLAYADQEATQQLPIAVAVGDDGTRTVTVEGEAGGAQ